MIRMPWIWWLPWSQKVCFCVSCFCHDFIPLWIFVWTPSFNMIPHVHCIIVWFGCLSASDLSSLPRSHPLAIVDWAIFANASTSDNFPPPAVGKVNKMLSLTSWVGLMRVCFRWQHLGRDSLVLKLLGSLRWCQYFVLFSICEVVSLRCRGTSADYTCSSVIRTAVSFSMLWCAQYLQINYFLCILCSIIQHPWFWRSTSELSRNQASSHEDAGYWCLPQLLICGKALVKTIEFVLFFPVLLSLDQHLMILFQQSYMSNDSWQYVNMR